MSDSKGSPPVPLSKRVSKSRKKLREEGGKRLDVWLSPDAAAALEERRKRTGKSATQVISDLLLSDSE